MDLNEKSSLRVGEVDIKSSTCIKTLGLHIDNMLSMKKPDQ